MSRAEQNDVFLNTSFLYGANAAWIEDLYARYETDPNSVSAEWQAFFAALKDDPNQVIENARGASWRSPTGRCTPMASWSRPWTASGSRWRRPSPRR